MDNDFIAGQFSLLSKVMDIHGENSFKSKSYSIASFNVEKIPDQLSDVDRDKIFSYKGIGESIGKKIIEILDTGELSQLKELVYKTPAGVMEMLLIKGIGPKKISTIWKEMEIESLGELLYACNENRLMLYKGFGEKTQKNVQDAIEFYMKSKGSYLYAEAERSALAMDTKIKEAFPGYRSELTGELKRQLEIINIVEWITTIPIKELKEFFALLAFTIESEEHKNIGFKGSDGINFLFHITDDQLFFPTLVKTSASNEFKEFLNVPSLSPGAIMNSEEDVFKALNQPFIPAFLREDPAIFNNPPALTFIQPSDIRGIIHCHSTWSDGNSTIEELAKACIESKIEYLVISDHSKSAFYANGLQEERIRGQQHQIDELNSKLAPFMIFKSIECDILNDGSLDYSDDILSTFDLVIASVHSNLKMTEQKAMARLLKATQNPFTTILGHMTGRLLLSRNGYPVDHQAIIESCAANNVVIELNAHPRRLDMDWRWIRYAVDKGVMISIDPDAHYIHGFDDIRYGVLSAQKAGLTKENNLSSFPLAAFEKFISDRKKMKGL
jgi:DNA polymerase (family 10)